MRETLFAVAEKSFGSRMTLALMLLSDLSTRLVFTQGVIRYDEEI